ncbi:hypothetical protein IWX90DRAFT_422109 [Phyllosticta citrichinensis]|uniref:Uncharacterized protein n=1 Tax=Phyllosticta citrichinensis TaxID=1130410 RepID=A0ABR1Y7G3_9PEZI
MRLQEEKRIRKEEKNAKRKEEKEDNKPFIGPLNKESREEEPDEEEKMRLQEQKRIRKEEKKAKRNEEKENKEMERRRKQGERKRERDGAKRQKNENRESKEQEAEKRGFAARRQEEGMQAGYHPLQKISLIETDSIDEAKAKELGVSVEKLKETEKALGLEGVKWFQPKKKKNLGGKH